MYRKYMVYLDDGRNVFKVAVAAICEEAAMAFVAGNGEVIAVKDVTEEYPIDNSKVMDALIAGGFGEYERDFICRALAEFGIAE